MIPKNDKTITTVEAFYRLYRALPKKDRLKIARHIFEDQEIIASLEKDSSPNALTSKAFEETRENMPAFSTIEDLRKDLQS